MLLSGCPPFWHEHVEQLLAAVQRGKFDFKDPVWRGVSWDAKDLINGLLQFDPEQRLSCDEVRGSLPHALTRLLGKGSDDRAWNAV
jgi:calcium/calmodulin-dependent protein kinase I